MHPSLEYIRIGLVFAFLPFRGPEPGVILQRCGHGTNRVGPFDTRRVRAITGGSPARRKRITQNQGSRPKEDVSLTRSNRLYFHKIAPFLLLVRIWVGDKPLQGGIE